jgi:hypothetical protein
LLFLVESDWEDVLVESDWEDVSVLSLEKVTLSFRMEKKTASGLLNNTPVPPGIPRFEFISTFALNLITSIDRENSDWSSTPEKLSLLLNSVTPTYKIDTHSRLIFDFNSVLRGRTDKILKDVA